MKHGIPFTTLLRALTSIVLFASAWAAEPLRYNRDIRPIFS